MEASQMATTIAHPKKGHRSSSRHAEPSHPHSVPILEGEDEAGAMPDQPFVEGAYDVVDPDLRHRMISAAAYQRYVERGYADGYDLDDWMAAETEVEHVLVNRRREAQATPAREAELEEVRETGGHEGRPRGIVHDEAMKRIIRQHPQRDIPRVESIDPSKAPSKE
jgi:hypothetical protein